MLDMSNTGPAVRSRDHADAPESTSGRDEIGRAFRGSSALHAVGDCTPSATVTCYWRGLQRKLGNDSRARVCWICRIQGLRCALGTTPMRLNQLPAVTRLAALSAALRPCTPSATARRRRQLLAT